MSNVDERTLSDDANYMNTNAVSVIFPTNSWNIHDEGELDWDADTILSSHPENKVRVNDLRIINDKDNHNNLKSSWSLNSESINEQLHQQKRKISDAITYGPRFCSLFNAYRTACNKSIDISRHLMTLCIENLIDFVRWARESESQTSWVNATLLEHDYLRCEMRNGVIMVLIYTFASIKASLDPVADMFSTLQDNDCGLGISNKFSLKIYNDPFFYLSFLKVSLSALIDAGVIPDNERLNQPKRFKNQFENKEEIFAFKEIQQLLVSMLDSSNIVGARNLVQDIATLWQQKGKQVRNRRFIGALNSVRAVPSSSNNLSQNGANSRSQPFAASKLIGDPGPNVLNSNLHSMAAASAFFKSQANLLQNAMDAADSMAMYTHPNHNNRNHPDSSSYAHHPSIAPQFGKNPDPDSLLDPQTNSPGGAGTQSTHHHHRFPPGVFNELLGKFDTPDHSSEGHSNGQRTDRLAHETVGPKPSNLLHIVVPVGLSDSKQTNSVSGVSLEEKRGPSESNSDPLIKADRVEAEAGWVVPTDRRKTESTTHQSQTESKEVLPSRPLQSMRFERVGVSEWTVFQSRIYDLDEFLNSLKSLEHLQDPSLYLVNESSLQQHIHSDRTFTAPIHPLHVQGTAEHSGGSQELRPAAVSLQRSLQSVEGLLITYWPKHEYEQFKRVVEHWRLSNRSESSPQQQGVSLSSLWGLTPREDVHPPEAATESDGMESGSKRKRTAIHFVPLHHQGQSNDPICCDGVIVYEVCLHVGFTLKASKSLPMLSQDESCWCYPNELEPASSPSITTSSPTYPPQSSINPPLPSNFGEFLTEKFPQLRIQIEKLMMNSSNTGQHSWEGSNGWQGERDGRMADVFHRIVVKHCSIETGQHRDKTVRTDPIYQTIGTLSTPIHSIFSRIPKGSHHHFMHLDYFE